MLRNPNLVVFGTSYPDNVYEVTSRTITPNDENTTVEVTLACFTNESKEHIVNASSWILTGLTTDPALLSPSLYQTKLLENYADAMQDGTLLSEFEVLS